MHVLFEVYRGTELRQQKLINLEPMSLCKRLPEFIQEILADNPDPTQGIFRVSIEDYFDRVVKHLNALDQDEVYYARDVTALTASSSARDGCIKFDHDLRHRISLAFERAS